jgi:AcrR family transcriptional regulator
MAMAKMQRSQQQRTETTTQLLLHSATRLFGERGYAHTSLDDIANDCGLTIGAIYHHFGNKKNLFAAVNEAAERRIVEVCDKVHDADPLRAMKKRWKALLTLSNEAGFRRIVLIDSPNILGRDRWENSEVSKHARALADTTSGNVLELQLALRLMRGLSAEAIHAIAEANNAPATRKIVDRIVNRLYEVLIDELDINFASSTGE